MLTPSLPERDSLLREAWASVESQTVPVEHLVSIDRDREGPSAVRNWLASQATAEWLLPLDDDDLLDPDCVETLLAHSADADVVYPWARYQGRDDFCFNRLFNADALMRSNYIPVTALIRRDLFNEVGGYQNLPQEDYRLWLRLLGAGAVFKCVDEVLWTYRFHDGNTFQKAPT